MGATVLALREVAETGYGEEKPVQGSGSGSGRGSAEPGRAAGDRAEGQGSSAADEAPGPDFLDELGDEIATLAAHIHAATHRLLTLIARFDRLRGLGGGRPPGLRRVAGVAHRHGQAHGERARAGGEGAGGAPPDEPLHEPGPALLLQGAGPDPRGRPGERGRPPGAGRGGDGRPAGARGARLEEGEPPGRGGPGRGGPPPAPALGVPRRGGHVRHPGPAGAGGGSPPHAGRRGGQRCALQGGA